MGFNWTRLAFVACVLQLASCGGGGGGGSDDTVQTPLRMLSLVAGTLDEGGPGSTDGTGAAARFNAVDFALGADGNAYVADYGNGTLRKVTPAGVVTTPLGSVGEQASVDGTGAQVRFSHPRQIASTPDGSLYVMEAPAAYAAPYRFRRIGSDGSVTTLLTLDGAASPYGDRFGSIAIDAAGDLVVADAERCELRRLDVALRVFETMASFPFTRGGICTIRPEVAADSQGAIYYVEGVANSLPQVLLNKRSTAGVITTVFDFGGATPGPFAVRRDGTVVLVSNGDVILAVPPDGAAARRFSGVEQLPNDWVSVDGDAETAKYADVHAMRADADGSVLLLDSQTLRRLQADGSVTTIAGLAPQRNFYTPGVGEQARLGESADTLMVADTAGNAYTRIFRQPAIARITPDGVVSTFVGSLNESGLQDGVGTAARFQFIAAMARDPLGTLTVAHARDFASCGRYGVVTASVVRQIDANGGVRTLPTAFSGSLSGVAPLAGGKMLAIGQHYVSPCNTEPRTVELAPDGAETVVGEIPAGPVVGDGSGNTYFIVGGAIHKRFPDGHVVKLAGSDDAYGDSDGVGAAARFGAPGGLDVDAAGTVYVADTGNSTVRKITPDGTVTTVIGRAGQAGIRLGALPGGLDHPSAVAVVPQGLLIRTKQVLLRASR